jgi:hypothetical protein
VPTFKYYKIPQFLFEKDVYSNKDFIDEDIFVDDWLQTFDIPNLFKRIALEVKREGKSTYVLRNKVEECKGKQKTDYATLQKLPTNYTKLTAIGEHGYIASFNMLLFMNPAFSVNQYPEFIREIWNDMFDKEVVYVDEKSQTKFNLNKAANYSFNYDGISLGSLTETRDRVYLFWVQLPQDLCYTFASDSSNAWVAPDTAGLFLDLQELTDYSTLNSTKSSCGYRPVYYEP